MSQSESSKSLCFIGLGSNLKNPSAQIHSARIAISSLKDVVEQGFSSLYHSSPMGPQDQPDYINAVIAIETDLKPMELLMELQAIENNHGRVRKDQRWGARTLDLDILLYDQQCIDLPDLIVPHYGIAERAFVLYPLQEIAADLMLPGLGKIEVLIANCPRNGLVKIAL
jgi:2-amino-4-hydroxy-6-hydroxymethyldihydropteridine diphosphokinase